MRNLVTLLVVLLFCSAATAQTIDQLGAGAPLTGTEKIPVFQNANPAVTTTPAAIGTFIGGVKSVSGGCGSTASPNPVTSTGSIFAVVPLSNGGSPVSTSPYAISAADCGSNILLQSGASSLTLVAASNVGFAAGFFTTIDNQSGSTVTLSIATSTLDGASTILIPTATTLSFNSDGTNYHYLQQPLTSAVFVHPGYSASGNPWYTPVVFSNTALAGTVPTGGTTTYFSLGYVPKKITISSLAARLTTQGSSNFQFGVYNVNPSTPNRPGTPVGNTGSVSNNVTAPANVSAALISNIQIQGWYFFALQTNDATVRFLSYSANSSTPNSFAPFMGSTTLANVLNTTTEICGLSTTAQTFGTWGDLTSASFTELTSLLCPVVAFQISTVP